MNNEKSLRPVLNFIAFCLAIIAFAEVVRLVPVAQASTGTVTCHVEGDVHVVNGNSELNVSARGYLGLPVEVKNWPSSMR